MKIFIANSRFARATAAAVLFSLCCPSTLPAKTRKGDKFLAQGRVAESKRDFDRALELFEQALADDPTDPAYLMATRRVRFQAGMLHVDAGQKLRNQGNLEGAMAEFQKAYAIDPSATVAVQEIRRTQEMLDNIKKKKPEDVKPDDSRLTPVQQAQRDSDERITTIQGAPELRPISRQPITLKMNNQPPKILFETVAKLAGINLVFDSEYQLAGKNYSLDLTNATLEQALDFVSIQTKSFWKPLSVNTIFITQDNVTKRRDYEDLVVRTFYLKNTTTAQELQEIATAIRSVTEIRRVFTYNAQNAILVRGTVDQVALTEKLVQDLDKPKSEVIVDVVVMEVNSALSRELTAGLTSGGGNVNLKTAIGFTPRNPILTNGSNSGSSSTGTTTTTGSTTTTTSNPYPTTTGSTSTAASGAAVSLAQVGRISTNDFSINLPGAIFNSVMSDRGTRVLQAPQVRAVELQKASLRIGDKIPYATGSFQPGVGTIGVSPLVSTQFQFAEVGVNVDMTPKVHGPEEVSMHIEIEISSVRDSVTIGGISQPVIGQRKIIHDIRVREGEVNLIGGLMQAQESKSIAGIGGLASIPLIRRLFSGENVDKSTGELLIALIPHIVRAPEFTPSNLKGVAAGNDSTVKLSYGARPSDASRTAPPAAATPAPAAGAPAPAASPAPAGTPVAPGAAAAPPPFGSGTGTPVPVAGQPQPDPSTGPAGPGMPPNPYNPRPGYPANPAPVNPVPASPAPANPAPAPPPPVATASPNFIPPTATSAPTPVQTPVAPVASPAPVATASPAPVSNNPVNIYQPMGLAAPGTGSAVRVMAMQNQAPTQTASPSPYPPPPAAAYNPATPMPAPVAVNTPAPVAPAAPAPVAPPVSNPVPAVAAAPAPTPEPAAAKEAAPVKLAFEPGKVTAARDESFTVALHIENAADLASVPMRLQFDYKVLKLVNINAGDALSKDGARLSFKPDLAADRGEATVYIGRPQGGRGINASGTLVTFEFKALRKGTAKVGFGSLVLSNSHKDPIPVESPVLSVTVQ